MNGKRITDVVLRLPALLVGPILLLASCSAFTQPPSQSVAPSLGGTAWQLVKFQGSDDTILTPDDETKYTIAFADDGRLSVRID